MMSVLAEMVQFSVEIAFLHENTPFARKISMLSRPRAMSKWIDWGKPLHLPICHNVNGGKKQHQKQRLEMRAEKTHTPNGEMSLLYSQNDWTNPRMMNGK